MDWILLRQSLKIRAGLVMFQSVCNLALPDHVSDGFVAPAPPAGPARPLDAPLTLLLGGLHRWDAQYFLHVAQHGYTHENTLAFLPGFPLLVRAASSPLLGTRLASRLPAQLAAAVLLNALLTAAAAQALYALSVRVLADRRQARTAALLFCFSPASIFLTAPYSEALFACLSFTGMLLVEAGLLWGAAAAIGFATCTRSNGVLLVGFFLYRLLYDQLLLMYPPATKENPGSVPSCSWVLLCAVWRAVQAVCLVVISLAAFCVFQVYAFVLYCTPSQLPMEPHVAEFVASNHLVTPGNLSSPWCNHTLPFSYGYIQSHYWEVGFLRYFTLYQIPNFLLAAPCVLLVLHGAATYLRRLVPAVLRDTASLRPLPYVLHVTALTCFMVLCAHVQVTTRVVAASSPAMYWFGAQLLHHPADRRQDDRGRQHHKPAVSRGALSWLSEPASGRAGHCLQVYFLSYMLLGTLLFSNNLPWT